MRQMLEPALVDGPEGDPGLYVDLRDEGRALLFDFGGVERLPPRKLLRVRQVFVSHTHMDHFAGFDTMLRVLLGRQEQLALFGGPGFVEQVEHKLRAYTWNVVQRYEPALVLDVHAFAPDGTRRHARFSSRHGFARDDGDARPASDPADDLLHEDALLRVRGRFVDHEMPCLAFLIEERPRLKVAKDRLAALGISTGPWLRTLRQAVLAQASDDTPIEIAWRDRAGAHAMTRTVGELRALVLDVVPGQRVAYATDLRGTEANAAVLAALLDGGVDRLYLEAVFLDADRDHATRKNHLTARQCGELARRVGARALVPFHFSPRYERRPGLLAAEAQAAFIGDRAGETGGAELLSPGAAGAWRSPSGSAA